MMKLYIDCEWNDYKGDLISMALCAEDGEEFYEVLHCKNPSIWVEKNVIPILYKEAVPFIRLQLNLQSFLLQYDSIELVADWPEDIERFCNALITGPGQRLKSPPITMTLKQIESDSAVPHNALFDARGIRDAEMTANA